MLPTFAVGCGDKDFEWRVAGACTHAGKRSIDTPGPILRGDYGIGDTQ